MAPIPNQEAHRAPSNDPSRPETKLHDVVIVGAGPAGLMLATCLAQMGVKPFIIDSSDASHHSKGRGDALQCRTIEVMRAIGVGQEMVDAGVKMFTRTFWDMTKNPPRCNSRSDFFSAEIDCDDCYSLGIRQGLVEQMLAKKLYDVAGVRVARNWAFEDAEIHVKRGVQLQIRSEYGEMQMIQAKYLVGCDGGKSTVRRMMRDKHGISLDGDAHDSRWSAVDVIGLQSDFPDLRNLSILHGHSSTILIIPREQINGKSCVRFYCQIDDEQIENPSLEDVIQIVKQTFSPYQVAWEEVHWFTVYRVGQRLASSFDCQRRIFLAGDAAHLHSPKGGLGMNTSLLDAHNLAFKIAMVEKFSASANVLDTYGQERRLVAKELINMDRELIRLFVGHKNATPETSAALAAFQRKNEAYQSGTSIVYPFNLLIRQAQEVPPSLSGNEDHFKGLTVGSRLLPATVTRHQDCNPTSVLEALEPYDGRFTVFACLGQRSTGCLVELSSYISRPTGLWRNFPDLVQVAVVAIADHLSIELSQELALICADNGPIHSSSVYCDDISALSPYTKIPSVLTNPLHTKWNIDKGMGALVVVRPDGHVGAMTRNVTDWDEVEAYFSSWLSVS